MPKALDTDWEAIRALYAAGATAQDIADKTGLKANTIRVKAARGKWKGDKQGILSDSLKRSPQQGKNLRASQDTSILKVKTTDLSRTVNLMANQFSQQKEKFLRAGGNVASVGMEMLSEQIERIKNDSELSATEKLANISKIAGELMKTATPVFGLKDSTPIQVGMQVNILSDVPEVSVLDSL